MRLTATIALVLGLVAAACTTAEPPLEDEPVGPAMGVDAEPEPPEGPQAGGTLRVGLGLDPVSIDPRFVVDDEGELIVDALFDPLVRLDPDGEIEPAAADRWEVDEDGRTFTFELRAADFHDATPVTADDFVRTFERIADGTAAPPSFLGYLLTDVRGAEAAQDHGEPLAGVEALDDRTLRIELAEPRPGFLSTLAHPSLVPTPPAADEDLEAYGEQPIGNGPFAMAGPREPASFVRLTAVEGHPDAPLLDEVLFTVYPDDDGSPTNNGPWEDLQDGQLHVASIPPERREEAETLFGRSADGYTGPGLVDGLTSTGYLYGFDTTVEPFDDARVRRAISMAIDRETLADEVLDGTREAATAILPPPFPGSQSDVCDHCVHDPAGAAELLAEVVAELTAGEDGAAGGPGEGGAAGTEGTGEGQSGAGDGDDVAEEDAGAEGDAGSGEDAGAEGDAAAGEAGAGEAAAGEEGDGDGVTVDGEEGDGALEDGEDGNGADDDPTDGGDPRGPGLLEGLPGDAGALVPQEPGAGDGSGGTDDDAPVPGTDDEASDPAEVIAPITLTHNRGATHTAVAERMATDIEDALGLEVDFQAQDLQPFIQGVRSGDTPVFRLGWDVAGPDTGAYLFPLFHSSQVGVDNLTRYENEEVDGLLEAARAAEDDLERRRLYREAEVTILEDAPAIPLLWSRLRLVIAPEVQDLVVTPFGRFGLRDAWLEPAAP